MTEPDVLAEIADQGVIPVLRSKHVADALATARAASSAGMGVIELTCSTGGIEQAVRELADEGVTVGLGTVTEPEQVSAAAAAGARFVVSFANPAGVQARAMELGLEYIPGAFTPGEVHSALKMGARAVKIFPAQRLGPAYLRDLRAVMPEVSIVATGGIGLGDGSIEEWLRAGALAVGLGSDLGSAAELGSEEVARRAAAALDQAKHARR